MTADSNSPSSATPPAGSSSGTPPGTSSRASSRPPSRGHRTITIILAVVAAAGIGYGVCRNMQPEPEAPPPPNILVIMVDTLRADHLGAYGYTRNTSPFTDQFARENVLFYNAYTSAPWTKPAVASLLTSLRPSVHLAQRGQRERLFDGKGNPNPDSDVTIDSLGQDLETLAERLRDFGYDTYGWTANMQVQGFIGFGQGFDRYWDNHKELTDAEIINASALEVLSATRDNPWFAYLHYMDVHAPYEAPLPWDARFDYREDRQELDYDLVLFEEDPTKNVRGFWTVDREASPVLGYHVDRYDGEIKYWDSMTHRLLAYLDWKGQLDNTVVVILSDHGEEWMEHGGLEHGFTLYEEMIQIPLIMHFPERFGFNNLTVQQQAEIIDVMPTLLDAIRAPRSLRHDMQGKSLLPALKAAKEKEKPRKSEEIDPYVYAEMVWRGEKEMISDGQYKLIRNDDQTFEFYNLHQDPEESRNRYHELNWIEEGEDAPAVRPSHYRGRLDLAEMMNDEKRQQMGQEQAEVHPPQEFIERSRAIGYVGGGGEAPRNESENEAEE